MSDVRSNREWSGDDFREMLAALYYRPGWKARNLDAEYGRVYDLLDWRDRRALVDVDWADGYVTGYIGDLKVYEARGTGEESIRSVFEAVEDALMRQENER